MSKLFSKIAGVAAAAGLVLSVGVSSAAANVTRYHESNGDIVSINAPNVSAVAGTTTTAPVTVSVEGRVSTVDRQREVPHGLWIGRYAMGWPLVRHLRLLGTHALPRSIMHLDDQVHAPIRRDAQRELHARDRQRHPVRQLHRHGPSGIQGNRAAAQLRAARAIATQPTSHHSNSGRPTRRPELCGDTPRWLTIKRLTPFESGRFVR